MTGQPSAWPSAVHETGVSKGESETGHLAAWPWYEGKVQSWVSPAHSFKSTGFCWPFRQFLYHHDLWVMEHMTLRYQCQCTQRTLILSMAGVSQGKALS